MLRRREQQEQLQGRPRPVSAPIGFTSNFATNYENNTFPEYDFSVPAGTTFDVKSYQNNDPSTNPFFN